MFRRRRQTTGMIANPVLVGAVTLLVVNIATFLSWNANRGLPFVPTRQVDVEMPNGAALLPGNDVREGGYRIGIVSAMRPTQLSNGEPGALVTVKLDLQAGELPADTEFVIRPRSVLGLKYVEVQRGDSPETIPDGGRSPISQSRVPVELDQFYNIFDEETRRGMRSSLRGYGDTLTMRGPSLNRAIEELPRLLRHLQPVATVLADPETDLRGFFKELGDFTRVVEPVIDRYVHSFSAGADAFEAWSRDEQALQETIAQSAPTMRVGIRSFRVQRPFLRDLADFSEALENAADELPTTLPRIIPALETAQPVLRRTPPVNLELRRTFASLDRLMRSPGTGQSLRALDATVDTLNPTLRFAGPYITVCNYWNYSWTNVADHLTEPDVTGGSQRTLLNQATRQENSPGSLGAPQPAHGERPQGPGASIFLHSNAYTAAVDRQGNADCESGQRGYIRKANVYGEKDIVVDPHIPGNQGPTFTGLPKVPEGQTFDRQPKLTPLPPELDP